MAEQHIFFADVETVSDAAVRYRDLALQWHPDRTVDPDAHAMMAAINAEYGLCIRGLRDGTWQEHHSAHRDGPRKRTQTSSQVDASRMNAVASRMGTTASRVGATASRMGATTSDHTKASKRGERDRNPEEGNVRRNAGGNVCRSVRKKKRSRNQDEQPPNPIPPADAKGADRQPAQAASSPLSARDIQRVVDKGEDLVRDVLGVLVSAAARIVKDKISSKLP